MPRNINGSIWRRIRIVKAGSRDARVQTLRFLPITPEPASALDGGQPEVGSGVGELGVFKRKHAAPN